MLNVFRSTAFLAGLVYFSQGALGIAGVALPLHLRSLGWTIPEITTISSLVAFPWVLKIAYGLISDTVPLFGYRRKSYLIVFAILGAFGWFCLATFPTQKSWIIFSLVMANLGFAATDVITDGVIVEHSTKSASAIFQGIAWGSRSLGAILSGFLGGWLASRWRPEHIFLLTVSLPLLVIIAVSLLKERKRNKMLFHDAIAPVRRCGKLLILPNMRWFIVVLLLASLSNTFSIPLFFYLKETLSFGETFLGVLSSLGWGGALLGSFIYVKWLRRFSTRTVLRWALVMNVASILGALLIDDKQSALLLVFLGGVLGCLVLLPVMTSAAILTHRSGVESTLFAVLMSLFNLGQIFFGYLGGKIYPFWGLRPLITVTGLVALGGLWVAERIHFKS